jgi:hypothetical protein
MLLLLHAAAAADEVGNVGMGQCAIAFQTRNETPLLLLAPFTALTQLHQCALAQHIIPPRALYAQPRCCCCWWWWWCGTYLCTCCCCCWRVLLYSPCFTSVPWHSTSYSLGRHPPSYSLGRHPPSFMPPIGASGHLRGYAAYSHPFVPTLTQRG